MQKISLEVLNQFRQNVIKLSQINKTFQKIDASTSYAKEMSVEKTLDMFKRCEIHGTTEIYLLICDFILVGFGGKSAIYEECNTRSDKKELGEYKEHSPEDLIEVLYNLRPIVLNGVRSMYE